MSFKDTLDALDARDAATALVEERFLESEREWKEILARRPMPPSSDTLTKVAELVRRHGPKASKFLGYPGLAAAITGAAMTPEGTFIGESGIFNIALQLFGF